jgi:ArsR family transcriptional regulator
MKKTDYDKTCCEVVADHENISEELLSNMPVEEDLYDLADFFKVFGDSTRVKILYLLLCSEMCVGHIAATLGMTQSAISHQLRFLKQMKLVTTKREGKTIFYSLADSHIESILSQGYEHIKE